MTPAQPTTAPVKPENKPKDNGKTVKPHAENATDRHGRKYVPAVAVKNTTKPQGVVSANKKQNQKTLPQTGAKKVGKNFSQLFFVHKIS